MVSDRAVNVDFDKGRAMVRQWTAIAEELEATTDRQMEFVDVMRARAAVARRRAAELADALDKVDPLFGLVVNK